MRGSSMGLAGRFECSLRKRPRRITDDDNRRRFNELIATSEADSEEAALLFYYLNRTAFNGLCRFNRSGFFNVPFGRYKSIAYRSDFSDYRDALSRYDFECGDFETTKLTDGDFVYSDPPYDVPFTSYSADGFTWADQVRLADWLTAHNCPGDRFESSNSARIGAVRV